MFLYFVGEISKTLTSFDCYRLPSKTVIKMKYQLCLKYTAGFLTKVCFSLPLAMFHTQGKLQSLQQISSECGFSFIHPYILDFSIKQKILS